VISGPYTKGSVRMTKGGFYSRLASNEITTRGYKVKTLLHFTLLLSFEYHLFPALAKYQP
jgi:hypothetical protein